MLDGAEAVFFDLDETLIVHGDPFRAMFLRAAKAFAKQLSPVTPEEFTETFAPRAVDMWYLMVDGHIGGPLAREYAFRNALRSLDCDLGIAAAMRLKCDDVVVASGVLTEGAIDVLDALRRSGRAVGIVTNGYADLQRRKAQRHGLVAHVDFVLPSEYAGSHKPDTGIFEQAMRRVPVAPEKSVFVGDLVHTDITGATEAGLHAVLYDPSGSLAAQLEKRPGLPHPDYTIQALPELLSLLGIER